MAMKSCSPLQRWRKLETHYQPQLSVILRIAHLGGDLLLWSGYCQSILNRIDRVMDNNLIASGMSDWAKKSVVLTTSRCIPTLGPSSSICNSFANCLSIQLFRYDLSVPIFFSKIFYHLQIRVGVCLDSTKGVDWL